MSPMSLRSVVQYLKGLDLPATRDEIILKARQNDAPQDVVNVLERIPDRVYEEMDDIWRAIGQKI